MNSRTGTVRKSRRTTDARTIRTRRALGAALVELMLAHDFDDISVQQVLERAAVGRATFYTHFRSKQDLLLSDAERFLEALEAHFIARHATSPRVAPVAELFAHVADVEAFQRAMERAGVRDTVYALLSGHLARLIARRLAVLRPDLAAGTMSLTVASRVFAGALVELLRWWLDHPSRPAPREMDARFHDIVWGGIRGMTSVVVPDAAPAGSRITPTAVRP